MAMALWIAPAASSPILGRHLPHSTTSSTATAVASSTSTTTTIAFRRPFSTYALASSTMSETMKKQLLYLDINAQMGSRMPLSAMHIGTVIHNIEINPGQGAKLVRAAGTSAKILKEPTSAITVVRLPSGAVKQINSRCRATIGMISNPSRKNRKLRKAGQSRWLGRRPKVRGVAMNPVDHPHGGGN